MGENESLSFQRLIGKKDGRSEAPRKRRGSGTKNELGGFFLFMIIEAK